MTQVADFLAYLNQSGGKVWLDSGKLKYSLPTGQPELLEELRANKNAILEELQKSATGSETTPQIPAIPAIPATLEIHHLEDKPLEVSHLWDAITSNLTELATELRQRLSDYPSMVMLSEWVGTNHIRNRTHLKPVTSRAELEELIQSTRAVTPKNAVYVALRVAYNPLEPQDLYLLAGNGTALYNANKTKVATAQAAHTHKLEMIQAISDLGYQHSYNVTPINGVNWFKVKAWGTDTAVMIEVKGTDYTSVLEDVVRQCKAAYQVQP